MKVEMVMPQMGESITEGTILRWLKREGESVERDENILEISTDKVDSEIPSPARGTIVALLAQEGETVPVGQVVAEIETEEAAKRPDSKSPAEGGRARPSPPAACERRAPAETAGARPAIGEREASAGGEIAGSKPAPPPGGNEGGGAAAPVGAPEGRFLSPAVRSIAHTEGIGPDVLAAIPGSGRGGRLTRDDLLAYLESRGAGGDAARGTRAPEDRGTARAPAAAAPARDGASTDGMPKPQALAAPGSPRKGPAPPPAPFPAKPSETRTTPEGPIDLYPMDHIRQKIADHMVRSKATSPHVASVGEAEMTRIVRYRDAVKEGFERQEGFKLTLTPFFVLAAVRTLREFPFVNASIEGSAILVKRFINIGIAVATDHGLIVPVIRRADALNLLGLARAVNDLAGRARGKGLNPEEVTGGTFTITNMGMVGTLFGIPIIAQPQVAILGIGAVQKRAVVRDDAVAIRDMMYVSLSYDHRLVDGAMGGAFVERYVHHLESMDLPS